MMPGIRADGAARSIGMLGIGRDRCFKIRSLFMESSLRRKPTNKGSLVGGEWTNTR